MSDQKNLLKPELLATRGLDYDIDEVDGILYMLNHSSSSTVNFEFTEEICPEGTVILNGKPHNDWKVTGFRFFNDRPWLCVHLRGYLCEYDTEVPIHIEGFKTPDGRQMEPKDFKIRVMPHRNSYPEKYHEHDHIAYRAAAESAVLLENNGVLPLAGGSVLNLFGSGVAEFRNCVPGAGKINPRGCRSIYQALEETSSFLPNKVLEEFYRIPNNKIPPEDILADARAKSDTAVVIISRGTSENMDNRACGGEYYLSKEEERLFAELSKHFANTVAVLNVGYTIDVRFLEKYNISACVFTGLSGMFGTEALMSVLDGRTNPSGRLPSTWALDYFDIPASRNFLNCKENEDPVQTDDKIWMKLCYEEGMYVGYRYFTSFGKSCAFPFGFGLSYTQFEQSVCGFYIENSIVKLSVEVKNTGGRPGKDVVQIYVSKPENELEQPVCELAAFAKTRELASGESVRISLEIPFTHITSYSEKEAAWKLCSGKYRFFMAEHAERMCEVGCMVRNEPQTVQQVKNRVCPKMQFKEISRRTGKAFPSGGYTFLSETPVIQNNNEHYQFAHTATTDHKNTVMFSELEKNSDLIPDFVHQMTDDELCRMNVCSMENWNMNEKGIAGCLAIFEKYGMPDYQMTDGNSGVNIKKPNIGMPASSMVAASFDTELACDVGRVIAEEALENEIDVILGPGMNLQRNPLNGRSAEYFSEDPLLAGTIAGFHNKGMQNAGISGCIKHAVANNCEALRKRCDSVISERTLREMYIRPFAYALEVEPSDTIMTGYNAVNGCFADENGELLEGIFREELGFKGFFMSDWNSYHTSNMAAMVRAGISLLTPGSIDDEKVAPLRVALQNGEITRAELERNIMRIIRVMQNRLSARKKSEFDTMPV